MDFEVQNSIVPTAYNLARFKVSGNLPTLQLNMSDIKYRSLMRLIDVCIPHFGNDAPKKPQVNEGSKSEFPLSPLPPTFALPGVFRTKETAYTVDHASIAEKQEEEEDNNDEQFFEVTSDVSSLSSPNRSLVDLTTDENEEPQDPPTHL